MNIRRLLGLETDEERAVSQWAFVGVIFLWATWGTVTEIRFLLSGQPARAYVSPDTNAFGERVGKLRFRYQQADSDHSYAGHVPFSFEDTIRENDQSIAISYIPGGMARVAGEHEWIAIFVFLLSGGVMFMYLLPIIEEARS